MAFAAAIGSIAQGAFGAMQAMYQGQVAGMNAEIAGENSKRALESSSIEAYDNDQKTAEMLADQEAAQAASGVSSDGRSQVLTRAATRKIGRRDTLNIIDKGNMDSYNYKVEQANFKAQQKAAGISAVSSLAGGFLGAAGSLPSSMVGGSSSVASPSRFVPKPIPKPVNVPKPVIPPLPAPTYNPLTSIKPPTVKPWKPINRGML